MSLRSYLLLLLAASMAVGVGLIAINEAWHERIGVDDMRNRREMIAVVELDGLVNSYDRFLVTYDLVIFGGVSYLAGDAVAQVDEIAEDLENLVVRGLLEIPVSEIARVREALFEAKEALGAIAIGDQAERVLPAGGIDGTLGEAGSLFQEWLARGEKRVVSTTQRGLENRGAQQRFLIASVAFFFLSVLAGLVWTARRIEGPITTLSRLARHRVGSGEPIELASGGPREFREISDDVRRLIESLESIVESRTRSLAWEVDQRQAAQVSVERINDELRQTVSNLRRTELALTQRAKLTALGEMVGGISHDFNNALVPILSYAEMLNSTTALTEAEQKRYLEIVIDAAQDAAGIVQRLQAFSRKSSVQQKRRQVDVESLIADALAMSEVKWRTPGSKNSSRQIRADLALDGVGLILGDAGELRQALVNIIFNASDAMTNGGTLRISSFQDEEFVYCAISDTGVGMSRETLDRCADAFFSTKDEKGTGLGLAMVQRTALSHGGELTIESRLGEGTTVQISLSRLRSDDMQPSDPAKRRAKEVTLRVLLIDDDETVLRAMTDLVRQCGCRVDSFLDAAGALHEAGTREFDLLITDLHMPTLSGAEVAKKFKAMHPETPVFLLTGFGVGAVDGVHSREVDRVLSKPVRRSELIDVLDEVRVSRDSGRRRGHAPG